MESLEALQARVHAQKDNLPVMYGDIDFSIVPERFAGTMDIPCSASSGPSNANRARVLEDPEKMSRALAYTMLGDNVADAYAALMPKYGFRRLIGMLTEACDKGVEHVADAPDELVAFIRAMEDTPDWIDMSLIEAGARYTRNSMAHRAPLAIRGAFVATFLNKYSALPMALTGTLSNEMAARRIKETANFFTATVLPGALNRHGVGFKSAAMVRLMHSMVRFNILRGSKKWDVATYGVPVPQIDQMPAGTIAVFLLAFQMIKEGRTEFTPGERAFVEFNRYRCWLLGLPEELLPTTPEGICDAMTMYSGTLRDGYDDETCGALVRATMSAYLPVRQNFISRIYNTLERSFSRVYFNKFFIPDDTTGKAKQMGVELKPYDKLVFIVLGLSVFIREGLYGFAMKQDALRDFADRRLVAKLHRLLVSYGHAEFTTDAAQYSDGAVKHQSA